MQDKLPDAGKSGRCPHCQHQVVFIRVGNPNDDYWQSVLGRSMPGRLLVWRCRCPNCHGTIVSISSPHLTSILYPFGSNRPPIPQEVTDESIAKDYREACVIADLSPNAAGALARRCLSQILVKHFGAIESDNLPKQIEKAKVRITNEALIEDLNYVRQIGRFSAHAKEDYRTGEIISVTPEEIEATFTIIEAFFEEVYVMPARRQERWKDLRHKVASSKKAENK